MAAGLYPLRLAQIGLESTAGTAVAATAKLVGDITYTPEIEREFEEFPRGVRAPVTGGGFALQHGSMFEYDGNLTFEEAVYIGLLGLQNDAAPTGTGPYVWTMQPVLTGATTVKTATIEFVVDDGSTKHHEREAAYCFMTEFEISASASEATKCKWTLEGRADGTSTVTTSLAPLTGRTVVPANLWTIYIDAAGGTLGSTQKTQTLREFSLKVNTGLTRDFTLDARTTLDHTGINSGMITGDFELTMEHNANAATEIAAWRSGGVRLVRLKADNGVASTGNKVVQIDLAMKYTDPPEFSQEDGIEIVTMKGSLEYDSTETLVCDLIITNGLSAQP